MASPKGPGPTQLTGPFPTYPSTAKKKGCYVFTFVNATDSPICDLAIETGPVGFLEFELFGIGGNPPDIQGVTVRKKGKGKKKGKTLLDQKVEDTTSWHGTMSACINPGEVFEVVVCFDKGFEPREWVEFSPSDADGNWIHYNVPRGETRPPETDVGDLIQLAPKLKEGLDAAEELIEQGEEIRKRTKGILHGTGGRKKKRRP